MKEDFKNYIQSYIDYADKTTNNPLVRECFDGDYIYSDSERKEQVKEMALRMAEADFESEFVYGREESLKKEFGFIHDFKTIKEKMEE